MFHQIAHPAHQGRGRARRGAHRRPLAGGTSRRRSAGRKPRPRPGRDFHPLAAAPARSGTVDFSARPDSAPCRPWTGAFSADRRMLLVEDSADTREALQRIFSGAAARSAPPPAAKRRSNSPSANLPKSSSPTSACPGMSGLEFMIASCAHLPELRRPDRHCPERPGPGAGHPSAAAQAGFDAHLLKPVEIAVLDQTLVEALQKRIMRVPLLRGPAWRAD